MCLSYPSSILRQANHNLGKQFRLKLIKAVKYSRKHNRKLQRLSAGLDEAILATWTSQEKAWHADPNGTPCPFLDPPASESIITHIYALNYTQSPHLFQRKLSPTCGDYSQRKKKFKIVQCYHLNLIVHLVLSSSLALSSRTRCKWVSPLSIFYHR